MNRCTSGITIQLLRRASAQLREQGLAVADTTAFIRAAIGFYHCDIGTPARHSWNAAFGRALARQAATLGISKRSVRHRVKDDNGRCSHACSWLLGG